MKATRITALVALLVMAGGVKMHGQEASEINQISAEQKVYELSVLWKEMSYNFGNMDNCPGLDIDSLYRAFIPKVTETKDDFEYWKMLQRFMACFNNGHTKIFGAPDHLVKHLAYPLLATSYHDGNIVIENFGARMVDSLHVGDTVVTINGMDALDYFREYHIPYVTCSNEEYKMQEAMFYFSNLNCCLMESDERIRLGIKDPKGVHEVDVYADYYLDPEKRDRNDMFHTGGNYWRTVNSFVADTTNSFAYLALTACNESFSEAFFSHYEEIQKADNLIIDISYNMGGYSSFCDTVLGYLVDYDTIYRYPTLNRVSNASAMASYSFIPDERKETEIDITKNQEYYLNHTFESVNYQDPSWAKFKNPVPASKRYRGNIYVLMGHETVSAAEYFAIMLSQNKRVVFLGEKTAGANAQPYYFTLPSGIKAMINIGKCYDFDNKDASNGFAPDYELDLYELFQKKSRKKLLGRMEGIIQEL